MRPLPAVVAISAAVHAALVAWVSTRERPPILLGEGAAPRIEIQDSAPVEVTLIAPVEPSPTEAAPIAVPEPASDPAPTPSPRTGDRPRRAAAISTGTAGTPTPGAEIRSDAPRDSPAQPSRMSMRKGRPPTLVVGVPRGSWDETERPPADAHAGGETGWLVPDGGGSYRSDLGAVTAKIDRDGSVTLRDKRNLNVRFALPGPKRMGRAIARWYEDDRKPVGTLGPAEPDKPILPGDDPSGQDKKPDHGQTVPIVGGSFDVTDALMRLQGIDPYAAKKLAYLDATRDERVRLGRQHRSAQLARAPEIMQKNLEHAIRSTPDARALRQALFELWDECAEPGPEVPAEIVLAGRKARALVIGFIRSKLPAGSPDAYSADELVRLNQTRSSRAVFAPYGGDD